MSNLPLIQTILVPQGAEYQAVRRGLQQLSHEVPAVIPIPAGMKPLTKFLQEQSKQQKFSQPVPGKVLVMGLCGSLNQKYNVGDVVLYENCLYQERSPTVGRSPSQLCTESLTQQIYSALTNDYPSLQIVKSWTSDRVICTAAEKRSLGETYGVDVVDMEGFAALDFLHQQGVEVAMLRVVSDDCHHDIPDIATAINPDGSLQPFNLALQFLRQPIAASHLIRGSLKGLKVLEEVAKSIVISQ